jgi:hypothetical protein
METECSLPHSQQLDTCSYAVPNRSREAGAKIIETNFWFGLPKNK